MFDVVNDVLAYPDFLPWCEDSQVLESSMGVVVARLVIAKAGMSQSFTTRNTLDRPSRISMVLVDGPFSSLQGEWAFQQLGEAGCKTEMDMKFDIDSMALNLLLGKVFEQAVDTMVDAFCERATVVYQS